MNTSLYRAAWRWHFYAGLIILPVLVWLAVTGGLYLYKPEIERAIYRDWIELGSRATPMPAGEMVERVGQATGGHVTMLTPPGTADESWRATVEVSDGIARTAFIDPSDGTVLGTTAEGGVMKTISDLHSLVITGPVGNALIEIVAGWAIILVITGYYLWWPRKRQPALALRGHPRERRFWRDVHASAGALVGAIVLFLAATGMPWSIFWGDQLHRLVTANEWGQPKPPGAQLREEVLHEGDHGKRAVEQPRNLPWSMQVAEAPRGVGSGDVGPDRVLAIAGERGLAAPYTLNLPRTPGAPYSISHLAKRPQDIRLIYVDSVSGQVLQDLSFADFGLGAQAVEWSIYTHQGQTYGEVNRLLMLAGCVGVILLAASAPVLWWKRRRAGRLQAPPRPAQPERARGLVATMVALGILYPMTGATMLLALAADRLLLRRRFDART